MAKNSVWRGAFWLSVGSFVSKLIGAIYRIFLPRILGDYGVGLFQMAYPLYSVLLAVSVNGIPTALSKQTAEKIMAGDEIGAESLGSWAQIMLGCVGMLLATGMEFGAPWIARHIFLEPAATWSIRALSPALAFVALEASFRGYFQGHQEMVPTAVSQILEQVVRVMVMFPLAYRMMPYGTAEAAAGATLGAPAGAACGMAYLLWKRIRHRPIRFHQRVPWGDLWRLVMVALPMSLSGLLFPMMLMADSMFVPQRLLLTGLTLREATARFGQLSGEAMPLVNLTMVVGAALAVSLVPAVAKHVVKGESREATHKVSGAVHLVWLIGLPMSGGLYMLAAPLTRLLYGESGASLALEVLALGSTVLAIQQVLGSSLQAAGHGWIPVKNLVLGAAAKFSITWWLTPLWGIRGAAMGTVAAALVTAYLNWRDWGRVVGKTFSPFRTMRWPILGTVLMAMALKAFLVSGLVDRAGLRTMMAIGLGVVVYGAVMVLSGEADTVFGYLKRR